MKRILDAKGLSAAIDRMVDELAGVCPADLPWAVVGIRTRGVALAERVKAQLAAKTGRELPLGWLDITLYRDDLHEMEASPLVRQTKIDFDPTDMCIILVDDVLFTGRTIRAALGALGDYGRPKVVRLAVLVDRGHRELPIAADVVGCRIETRRDEVVEVSMSETDDGDEVVARPAGSGR
ncbi:MAG TPA: bifunctional pyr operon transcriptional regulator/uracil phosphoribosyltransferase PyrR [Phycisphaerae bacterium]|nr:bifunctional pyr operon transcriptional regulator/uracil phosphoribosyltransferase PyrR [Phycisphaerae bacterium]HOI54714.1 bifunctional pyr operon transcriptional regulator/uracil phosphoribosyltransferase PyrR [Phycisphaerae bacterium]